MPRANLPLTEDTVTAIPTDIDGVETMLAGQGYVASRALATVVFLALKLGRPLFLEGEGSTPPPPSPTGTSPPR
jgi:MoxR-like ATPase